MASRPPGSPSGELGRRAVQRGGGARRGRLTLLRRYFSALLPLVVLLVLGCVPEQSGDRVVVRDGDDPTSLEGRWRFRLGDEPRFASPEYDDASWQEIEVPGIWRFRGVSGDSLGWYRRRFDLTAGLAGHDLALEIPYTYWAYEVRLNGKLLRGRYHAESFVSVLPAGGVNLFDVPQDLLRPTGNLVAVRVQGAMGHGGIYRANTRIGEHRAMTRTFEREVALQLSVAAVCAFIGFYHLLVFVKRREQRLQYLSFAGYALTLSVFLPAYGGFWYAVVPNQWFNTVCEFGAFPASFPLMPLFMHAIFAVPTNRFLKVCAAYSALTLAWMGLETWLYGMPRTFVDYYPTVVAAFLVTFGYSLAIAIRGALRREQDARLILIGFAIFAFCATNDVIAYFGLVRGGPRLGYLGFLGFCLVIALAIGNQYTRMMQNLARLRVGLQAEVNQRTAELNDKNQRLSRQADELRSLDELKRRFYANVSHELRTPLTLILGFLHRLRARGIDAKRAKAEVEAAERNAAHLLRDINDLLDVSRLEAGSMTLRAVATDLGNLVREVTELFVPETGPGRRQLRIDSGSGVVVHLDADKVRKVVFNLLSNAFKYTDDEVGVVSVRVSRHGDGALVEVEDNGVGIAEDELPKVFERFHQADPSTTRKYEGTGIGLALVRELVELHDGRVEVKSTIGVGSTFRVFFLLGSEHLAEGELVTEATSSASSGPATTIELQRLTAVASAAPPSAAAADPNAPEILVVEDHRDLRHYLISLLSAGYRVRSSSNGVDALKAIRERVPDLVVSDVMMPHMDGYELCNTIKNDPSTAHVPVVLLTAQVDIERKLRGLRARADDYLTKPFSEDELHARVDNLLLLARQRRELRDVNQGLEVRVLEQADALQRRARLRRFLPPTIVEELLGDAVQALERRRRLVAVLVAELDGFREIGESLEPEDVTVLFGSFHGRATEAIFRAGGTLVSLHQGSLTAVFGAPRDLSETDSSVAALQVARELTALGADLDAEWGQRGTEHRLALRVGVDVGHATVGAFGDNDWASFTALGGPALRAPELCQCAAPGEVVVSKRLASATAERRLEGPQPLEIRGRTLDVFRLRPEPGREGTPRSRTLSGVHVARVEPPRPGKIVRPEPKTLAVGQTLGERYAIEQELGRGGMGTVYAVFDHLLGDRIAMKVLHSTRGAELGAERMERLRHEVRLARQVTHHNVCRVFDLAVVDDHACLTMELVRGRSLRDELDAGRVGLDRGLSWARQICSGLAAAHGCGIVHRDLKPDNVLIDEAGRVVLTDFGIARPHHEVAGETTLRSAGDAGPEGAIDYLAPEQFDARHEPDVRADIYSLGVVLYQIFTGLLPFSEDNPWLRLRERLLSPPRDPAEAAPDIDPKLRAILLRCLHRDVTERFQRVLDVESTLLAVRPAADDARGEEQATAPASLPLSKDARSR